MLSHAHVWKRQALALGLLVLSAGMASAMPSSNSPVVHRDRWFEENLRFEACADKALTPAKALRWLRSVTGHQTKTTPSATEFLPIVNVHDSNVRVIAAISYKF